MAGEGLRDQMVVVPVAMLVAMVVGVHVRKMTTDKVAHARRSLGLILAQTTLFPSLSKSPGGGGGGGGGTPTGTLVRTINLQAACLHVPPWPPGSLVPSTELTLAPSFES